MHHLLFSSIADQLTIIPETKEGMITYKSNKFQTEKQNREKSQKIPSLPIVLAPYRFPCAREFDLEVTRDMFGHDHFPAILKFNMDTILNFSI